MRLNGFWLVGFVFVVCQRPRTSVMLIEFVDLDLFKLMIRWFSAADILESDVSAYTKTISQGINSNILTFDFGS